LDISSLVRRCGRYRAIHGGQRHAHGLLPALWSSRVVDESLRIDTSFSSVFKSLYDSRGVGVNEPAHTSLLIFRSLENIDLLFNICKLILIFINLLYVIFR
jgi:hypothetical protein